MASRFKELLNKKSSKKIIIPVGLILIGALALTSFNRYKQSDKTLASTGGILQNSQDSKQFEVNQQIQIPISKDKKQNITYQVRTAELKDSVILRGQEAKAVEGKRFLILNLKLNNPEEQRVKLDTRDFVRLSVNGGEDKLAPAIHNDPVELQPISDQYTRVGFSVNTSDTSFVLYLGQISEEKIEIPLSF